MPRPVRIEVSGGYYYIEQQGSDGIFSTVSYKIHLLSILEKACIRSDVELLSYCVLDRSYHLIIKTHRANLKRFMKYLSTSYANWFRYRSLYSGKVYTRRYKAVLLEPGDLLAQAILCVNRLPSVTGADPEDYSFSSFKSIAEGAKERLCTLAPDSAGEILTGKYSGKVWDIKSTSHEDCEEFPEGLTEPVHGSQVFIHNSIKTAHKPLAEKSICSEKTISYLLEILECGVEELKIKECAGNKKDIFIYILRQFTDLTLKDIGRLIGLKYKTVSKRNSRFKLKLKQSEKLRDHVLQIEHRLSQKLTQN